ncbi:MAG: serine dehydratase subunit alpha family protein [Oscillospiraceae bacterium]
MKKSEFDYYEKILREELVPAMGCTEPIAVAYAAAVARETLGEFPERVRLSVSANIIKNVKSVTVPNTGGMRGLRTAIAAGVVAGRAENKLEVIADVSDRQREAIADFVDKNEITVEESTSDLVLDIDVTVFSQKHSARCRIINTHTNIVRVEKDDDVIQDTTSDTNTETESIDKKAISVESIIEYADTVDTDSVKDILDRQISYNMAIAEEGIKNPYGAQIGRTLLLNGDKSVRNKAKAYAAAGSDARMNGCSLPVVINSGSGNQGITASVPVIVYAREQNAAAEKLYRALLVSNLVAIHLKTGIGCLSAYCGAISAGCGAAAGITYLCGGGQEEIAHTIVNALAINSGVICDGAKSSCAAKVASAIEGGILGMEMYNNNCQFYGGDGIVAKGVENTIENIGELAQRGMRTTDKEIIRIMLKN